METSLSIEHARDGDALTGRVALVTGGTRGIGAAISHSLASRGAAVAAGFSRNAPRADKFRCSLENAGADASVHQGNVDDWHQVLRVNLSGAIYMSKPAKVIESFKATIPMRRMGRPEEIARVVAFLAADVSAYITGQVWGFNGGLDM